MKEMSLSELEVICMALDKRVRRKVLLSRARLDKLPKYEGKMEISSWARCLIECSKCGALEGYACIENLKCWCQSCLKITLWKPKYRI